MYHGLTKRKGLRFIMVLSKLGASKKHERHAQSDMHMHQTDNRLNTCNPQCFSCQVCIRNHT